MEILLTVSAVIWVWSKEDINFVAECISAFSFTGVSCARSLVDAQGNRESYNPKNGSNFLINSSSWMGSSYLYRICCEQFHEHRKSHIYFLDDAGSEVLLVLQPDTCVQCKIKWKQIVSPGTTSSTKKHLPAKTKEETHPKPTKPIGPQIIAKSMDGWVVPTPHFHPPHHSGWKWNTDNRKQLTNTNYITLISFSFSQG